MITRAVQLTDLDQIALLIRQSFKAELTPYMTYAQPGIAGFLATFVARPELAPDRVFMAVEDQGDLVAFAEFRLTDKTTAFLSYICVVSAARGKGVATRLTQRFLDDHPQIDRLELDVFENNQAAVNLYRKLGFVENSRITWWDRPIPSSGSSSALPVRNLPFAAAAFDRYGFCELSVSWGGEAVTLGRVGENVIRCFSSQAFADDNLLAAAKAAFPQAGKALFISQEPSDPGVGDARKLNSSIRMFWQYTRQRPLGAD